MYISTYVCVYKCIWLCVRACVCNSACYRVLPSSRGNGSEECLKNFERKNVVNSEGTRPGFKTNERETKGQFAEAWRPNTGGQARLIRGVTSCLTVPRRAVSCSQIGRQVLGNFKRLPLTHPYTGILKIDQLTWPTLLERETNLIGNNNNWQGSVLNGNSCCTSELVMASVSLIRHTKKPRISKYSTNVASTEITGFSQQ